MNVMLAILFILMLITPCLLAFRGRSRGADGEEETAQARMKTPVERVEDTAELEYPRAGVVKAKARPAPALPRVAVETAPVLAKPQPVQAAPIAKAIVPRALTLQQRVDEAEEEARIAGAAAMHARDLARQAHGRAAALREEMAIQTAQFARYIATEAADAAHAAQMAYDEMRVWEQGLAREHEEAYERDEQRQGITALENRRAA